MGDPSRTLEGNSRERSESASGKKKAHKHKLFCLVALGMTPGLSQGQAGFVWDKPTLSQGQSQAFSLVCPWDNPRDKGRQKKLVCSKFMCLFLLAIISQIVLIKLRDRPSLELILIFSDFRVSLFLQDKLLELV